ncbi:hypothetical protein B0J11DRAFT_62230 [Dendryphion nanum]|uniref:Uncharacterized protein n=1 Tax=Dendryphion nanum TaxID=256645 RepID=A0A9P9IJ80_9PLEO|nr:hypothetical protein B0J11DRAFT_62230 [Dendryphion nanum]
MLTSRGNLLPGFSKFCILFASGIVSAFSHTSHHSIHVFMGLLIPSRHRNTNGLFAISVMTTNIQLKPETAF